MAGALRSDNYINIQGWMVSELGLKGNNLLIYAIIYGMSQDGKGRYTGGLNYLASWTNSSKRGVMKNLTYLCENGYIAKEEKSINNIKFCEYYVPFDEENQGENQNIGCVTEFHSVEQSSPGYGTKFTGVWNKVRQGGEQSSPNNKYNNKIYNKNNNTSSSSDEAVDISDAGVDDVEKDANTDVRNTRKNDVKKVIECWNALSQYGIKSVSKIDSGSKRYQMLCARIQQYGLDDVLKAVDNIKKSDFLQGKGSKGWMITFDWFVRPNCFPKVLEGNYEDKPATNGGGTYAGYSGRNDSNYRQAAQGAYDPADCYGEGWDKLGEFQGWDD